MLLASDYDKSRFMKAVDLKQEKKFRIKEVTPEEVGVGKDKETKLVVWFTNAEQGLVLNKTNNRTLRGAFGDDVAGWVNKIIVIFPTHADVRGKVEPAMRIRIPPQKKPPETATAAPASPAPSSGNGAAVSPPAAKPAVAPASDPELEPDPKLTAAQEMDDGIPDW
jgi:hypothetical protein